MANVDAAFGLKPIRHLNGNPWNGATTKMLVEDSYATSLFVGDPVVITGTAGADDTTGHYMAVNLATAGDAGRISGVIVSIEPILTDLSKTYIPGYSGGYVNVCIDPDVIYIVQDDAGATLDGGSLGTNCVFASGTGSTVTGLSAWELAAATTPAADASYQGTILAVHNKEGNAFGVNCIWEVILNNVLRSGAAGVTDGSLGI